MDPKVVEDVSRKTGTLVSEGVLLVYTNVSSKRMHCWHIPLVGGGGGLCASNRSLLADPDLCPSG